MGPCVRRDDVERWEARFASHLLLPGRCLALLLLKLLLPGVAAAVDAAGDGAEHAVMAGIVTGDAADHRTLDAALGVGGIRSQRQRGNGEQSGNRFHDGSPFKWLGITDLLF